MVDIKEFVQSGEYSGESTSTTQIGLKHNKKYVVLYCPDAYQSAEFTVDSNHYYYALSTIGTVVGQISVEEARTRTKNWIPDQGSPDVPDTKSETLTMTPGQTKKYEVVEGTIQGMSGLSNVKHDMNVIITLNKVDGQQVPPDPIKPGLFDDFNEWLKQNQWTIVGVSFLFGLLLVTYLVFRSKIVTAQPAAQPVVVVKE